MDTYKVLAECAFAETISEGRAQTQSGASLLNNYKSYCLAQPVSCGIVNRFLKEAISLRYDTGINKILENLSDYINTNKTSWALASVCETLLSSDAPRNYLNKNAATQAEKLLEMDEDNIKKYIRSGALKNIMFCEAFRNIANGVFRETNQVLSESALDYTSSIPVSMVENLGDAVGFVVNKRLFIQDSDGNVQESKDWGALSHTFKCVEGLLESELASVDENGITIKYLGKVYEMNDELGEGSLKIGDKVLNVDELREDNELYLRMVKPNMKSTVGSVLESIAKLCENYNKVVALDNVKIFTTNSDRFMVIENNSKLFASTLSGISWQVCDDALKVLEFINKKTGTKISEVYKENIQKAIDEADSQARDEIKKQLEESSIVNIKDRIANLTEKFKNDPSKLVVLSKLAGDLASI